MGASSGKAQESRKLPRGEARPLRHQSRISESEYRSLCAQLLSSALNQSITVGPLLTLILAYDEFMDRVSTLAGSGSPHFCDGVGSRAGFSEPSSVCIFTDLQEVAGGDGGSEGPAVLIADRSNARIRRLYLNDRRVETFVGSGLTGLKDGPRFDAELSQPKVIIPDPTSSPGHGGGGGGYFIAEMAAIRHVDVTTGLVRTVVAAPPESELADSIDFSGERFMRLRGVCACIDPKTKRVAIYASDALQNRILKVDDNPTAKPTTKVATTNLDAAITTVAGGGGVGNRDGMGKYCAITPGCMAWAEHSPETRTIYIAGFESVRRFCVTTCEMTTVKSVTAPARQQIYPVAIETTASGLLFIVCGHSHSIYCGDPEFGDRSFVSIAGTGSLGLRDSDASKSCFHLPDGLCFMSGLSAGQFDPCLIVADTSNQVIRRVPVSPHWFLSTTGQLHPL